MRTPTPCPQCSELATFSKKRGQFYCAECELVFDSTDVVIESQTIFLSYAHKSKRDEDYDVSEELVWLIKEELEKDGHQVWIDREGIAAGTQWRERITSAILSHTHFLSFLSKRSVRDPGVCLNEISIALRSGRQIQTLLTESEEAVRQPLTISHLQWHQFEDWKAIRDGEKTGSGGEDWEKWFGDRISQIRGNLLDLQKHNVAGDLQRLKDILEPRTFEAEIIAKIDGFYGRKWLFDACDQWLTESTKRLFWLKGSPGIGKSSFAAKLVHQSNSAIVGFFKCDFQGSKSPEQSASECIRTLAYQLAARLPDYRMKLLYEKLIDREKIQKKTADDLFTYLITEPLNTSGKIPEAVRLALLIDALDEAGRNDGTNALADLIYKHAENLPPWLGIIVTSRPEPYLEQQLSKFDATSIVGGTEQNLQDLKDYLNEKLSLTLGESLRSSIIDKIIDKSGGTFLYLKLIENDAALDLTKPEALPSGIDDVFMRDFKRYFSDVRAYDQDTEPFLRLMAAAPGPLPMTLAKDLLKWSNRDITTKVVEPLGSLLEQSANGLVFFHKSLADWLQDHKRSGLYQVNETGAQELGKFLWKEFVNFNDSVWQELVVEWLPILLPSSPQWMDFKSLDQLSVFLESRFKYATALELKERGLELITQLDDHHLVDFLDWFDETGELYCVLAKYDRATTLFNRSLDLRTTLYGTDSKTLATTLRHLGFVNNQVGDYAKAESLYRQSLKIAQQGELTDAKGFARTLNELAGILNMKADYEGAEKLIREALVIQNKFLALDDVDTAKTLNTLAILLRDDSRYAEAQECYQKAYDIFTQKYGVDHPQTARVLNNIGALKSDMGCHEDAFPVFQQSLVIRERLFGLEHPVVGQSVHNLANLHALTGDNAQAEILYKRALDIRNKTIGPNHYRTATTSYRYANLLEKNFGRLDEAIQLYDQSNRIRAEVFGLNHPMYSYDLD